MDENSLICLSSETTICIISNSEIIHKIDDEPIRIYIMAYSGNTDEDGKLKKLVYDMGINGIFIVRYNKNISGDDMSIITILPDFEMVDIGIIRRYIENKDIVHCKFVNEVFDSITRKFYKSAVPTPNDVDDFNRSCESVIDEVREGIIRSLEQL